MPLTLEESLIKQNQKFENKKYLQALKAQQEAAAQSAGLAQQRFQDIPVNQRPRLSSALMSDDSYAPALSQYVGQANYVPLANRIQADFQRGDAEKERLQNLMKNVKYNDPDTEAVQKTLEKYQIPEELTDDRFAYKKVGNLANEFYQNLYSNQHILGRAKQNYEVRKKFIEEQRKKTEDGAITPEMAEFNIQRFDERYAQQGGLTGPGGYDPNKDYRGNMLDYNYQFAPEDPKLNEMVMGIVRGWKEDGGKWTLKDISISGKQLTHGDRIVPSAGGYIIKHKHGRSTTKLTYDEVYQAVSKAVMQNEGVREYLDFQSDFRANQLANVKNELGQTGIDVSLKEDFNQVQGRLELINERLDKNITDKERERLEREKEQLESQELGMADFLINGSDQERYNYVKKKELSKIKHAAFNLGAKHQDFTKTESISEYDASNDVGYWKNLDERRRKAIESTSGLAHMPDSKEFTEAVKEGKKFLSEFEQMESTFMSNIVDESLKGRKIMYSDMYDLLEKNDLNKLKTRYALEDHEIKVLQKTYQEEENRARFIGLQEEKFKEYNKSRIAAESIKEELEGYTYIFDAKNKNSLTNIHNYMSSGGKAKRIGHDIRAGGLSFAADLTFNEQLAIIIDEQNITTPEELYSYINDNIKSLDVPTSFDEQVKKVMLGKKSMDDVFAEAKDTPIPESYDNWKLTESYDLAEEAYQNNKDLIVPRTFAEFSSQTDTEGKPIITDYETYTEELKDRWLNGNLQLLDRRGQVISPNKMRERLKKAAKKQEVTDFDLASAEPYFKLGSNNTETGLTGHLLTYSDENNNKVSINTYIPSTSNITTRANDIVYETMTSDPNRLSRTAISQLDLTTYPYLISLVSNMNPGKAGATVKGRITPIKLYEYPEGFRDDQTGDKIQFGYENVGDGFVLVERVGDGKWRTSNFTQKTTKYKSFDQLQTEFAKNLEEIGLISVEQLKQ